MNNHNVKLKNLIFQLWMQIDKKRKVQTILLFLLMIISSFAEVVSIGTILPFLAALTSPQIIFKYSIARSVLSYFKITTNEDALFFLTYIFCIAVVVSAFLRITSLWAQTKLGFSIGADLSYKIYHRTLYQPYSIHISRNSSEVISGILNKTHYVINAALIPTFTILSSLLFLTMTLVFLLFIDYKVTLTSILGFGLIYFLLMLFTRKKLKSNGKNLTLHQDNVIKILQEGLGGIRDVLIDGSQDVYCRIFKNSDSKLRKSQSNITFISGSPRYGVEALGMVLIAIIAYNLTKKHNNGISTVIPILGSLALAAQRLLPIVQQTFSSWASMQSGTSSLFDTLQLLNQPLPYFVDQKSTIPLSFTKNIVFSNLFFSYNYNEQYCLANINLTISKGTCIGLIGETGSGKSTFLDLLMGLQIPTKGSIFIDGVKIDNSNFRAWQVHIAHVPQHIYLSDNSIAENIAFGIPKEDIDFERVYNAASKAQISHIIESFEQGYNTLVGERGVRLSGGQRQRIGIARALYKNADVIVFDEATSALDNKTEKSVMNAIKNLSKELTIIIVAHRLTTLENCNQIIELKNGGIGQIGTYDEIIINKK